MHLCLEVTVWGAEVRHSDGFCILRACRSPRLSPEISKLYNLRLPEPYLLKLRFIAEHTPYSMKKFCLDVLLPAIDEKIDELRGEGGG
jgi:hypothetical protein